MLERFPQINTGDENISYQVTGEGPPLLCLHGLVGHERTYDGILPWFEKHFRIYQLAWPGFGTAHSRKGRYELQDMVRWVEAFRANLELERIHLMGNCIGANVALEYAYTHPERLSSLILNEPHAFMPDYFYLLLYPVIKDLLLRFMFKTPTGRKIVLRAFPLEEKGKGSGYTERRLSVVPVHSMASYLRAMYLYARETNLYARPKIKVPTIFPMPQETFGQVAAFENMYKGCFRILDVVKINGAVHNPVVETPEEFASAVLPRILEQDLTNVASRGNYLKTLK